MFKGYWNMIDCPHRFEDVKELPESVICAIIKQTETVARDMYNNWVGEASEQAQAMPNEDAYAYLFKQRRDVLIEITSERSTYSWRKRAIASNIGYLMGYDLTVEGWTNV